MNRIMAIIKPVKLDDGREALIPFGVQGLTVSEGKGGGRQKGQTGISRGAEYHMSFLPELRTEAIVPADLCAGETDTDAPSRPAPRRGLRPVAGCVGVAQSAVAEAVGSLRETGWPR